MVGEDLGSGLVGGLVDWVAQCSSFDGGFPMFGLLASTG